MTVETASTSVASPNDSTLSSNDVVVASSTTIPSGKTTPPRHNYHNTNTPIASIKRPRSSLIKSNNYDGSKGFATPLRSTSKTSSAPTSTPMSIIWTDKNDEFSNSNSNNANGLEDGSNNYSKVSLSSVAASSFASPLATASSRRGQSTNATTLSMAETEALTLSPMHGVRAVTYRDIHDIDNHNCSPPSALVLHDIDEDLEANISATKTNQYDSQSPSASSTTSSLSPTNGQIQQSSSWVGKKVDALFSPVYQFLRHEEQEQQQRNAKNNARGPHSHHHSPRNTSFDDEAFDCTGDDGTATPMVVVTSSEKGDGGDVTPETNSILQHRCLATSETQPSTATPSSSSSRGSNDQGQQIQPIASKDSESSDTTFDVNDDDDDHDVIVRDPSNNSEDQYADHDLDHSHHRSHRHDEGGSDDDNSMSRPEHPTDIDEFNPWQFIKSLPDYDRIAHNAPPITLPPKSVSAPDKTLVLDLDETLVHCTVEPPEVPADLTFPVVFHGVTYTVHVKLRPFLQEFLESIKGKFEIIVFTASQKVYADELLNLIDPHGIYIHHRLFRESCLAVDGNFLKDLNVLGRELSKTVLVDNSPHAFGYQVDNGIPIESWFDCPNDRELLKLERFLRTLLAVDDVRPMVRTKFQTYRLIEESTSTANMYG